MPKRLSVSALALVSLGAFYLGAQTRAISGLASAPTQIPVNTPVAITFVASVAPNATLISNGVNLTEVTQAGGLIRVVGQMYDDGTHGDVVAGDYVFTLTIAEQRTSPMYVWYRATAAYRGVVLRALSPIAHVFVTNPGCTFGFNPPSASFLAPGGTSLVNVSAPAGCPWLATPNVPWISIVSGASGSGNGSANYRVAANQTTSARFGSILVANQPFDVSQAGIVCTYSLGESGRPFPAAGGSGTVNVISPSGCPWTAASDPPWMHITSGTSGSGSGQVGYFVDANPLDSPRNGTLTIAGQKFWVTQPAGGPTPTCTVSAVPVLVRNIGITELAGEVSIACTGLPTSLTADVVVTLNTNLTSRLIPGSTASDALLLVNEPATPLLGVNAFRGDPVSYTTVAFRNVPIQSDTAGSATLHLVNLRVAASLLQPPGASVEAQVSIQSAVPINLSNSEITVAQVSEAATVGASVTSPTEVTLMIRETFPTAFRLRTGAAQALDPVAEAGYWAPSLAGGIGGADTATRIRAVFSVPPNVNVLVPVHAADGHSAQLVNADFYGVGGGFLDGSYVLLPQDSTTAATWEVRGADPTSLDQCVFNVVVSGATQTQIETIVKEMSLAPISTVQNGSSTAPIPRFVGKSLIPALPPLP